MDLIIPVVLLAIWLITAFLASNDGAWGAALICVATVFAGLLAMTYFEPAAAAIESDYSDFVALILIFAAGVTIIRVIADYFAPTNPELPSLVYDIGRFVFGGIAGYITMAFLCTALHTAPIPRDAFGFGPEKKMFFGMAAPDRQWLGFTQYFSERVMGSERVFDGPRFSGIPNADARFQGAMPPRWPSFIIRYAARREALSRGGRAAPRGFSTGSGEQSGQPKKSAQPAF